MTRFTLDQMDLDSEEAKFFGRTDDLGTLPPTKRPRPEGESSTYPMTKGKGKGKKGKGKGRGKESPPPPTWDYTRRVGVLTRGAPNPITTSARRNTAPGLGSCFSKSKRLHPFVRT